MKKNTFSVFVGGVEVNDYYMSEDDANRLALMYMDDGYDDVVVVENQGFDVPWGY